MRKLIAAMKISIDAKMEGPDGTADWVEAWSDDYGLTPHIDACVLGGKRSRAWAPAVVRIELAQRIGFDVIGRRLEGG